MGSCCTRLTSRDVYTMLSAKIPIGSNQSGQRDVLFRNACADDEYIGTPGKSCAGEGLANALHRLYDIRRISNQVAAVCEGSAFRSAIRFQDGKLNFKERRHRAALNAAGSTAAADAEREDKSIASPPSSRELERHALRYCLHYLVNYFRVQAIIEETAGFASNTSDGEACIELFGFRVARPKLESELLMAFPQRSPEEAFRSVCLETTGIFGGGTQINVASTTIPISSLVEFCTSIKFYEDLTLEDDPRRNPVAGDYHNQRDPSTGIDPPEEDTNGDTTTRGVDGGGVDGSRPIPPQPPTVSPSGRPTRRFEDVAHIVDPAGSLTTTTAKGTLHRVEDSDAHESTESSRHADKETVADSGAGQSTGVETGTVTVAAGLVGKASGTTSTQQQKGSPVKLSQVTTTTTTSTSPPRTVRDIFDLWVNARALIPLNASPSHEDPQKRIVLFSQFDGKKRGLLDEMDLYKGCQTVFMLNDVFQGGNGVVASQVVSAAFVSATHRLPEALAVEGIRTQSRFLVFLTSLVTLLDLHFEMKRSVIGTESRRQQSAREEKLAANTQVLEAQTHIPGPKSATSPKHHVKPSPPSTATAVGMSIYERNRVYQQPVGAIPVDDVIRSLRKILSSSQTRSDAEEGDAATHQQQLVNNQSQVSLLPSSITESPRYQSSLESFLTSVEKLPANGSTKLSLEKIGARVGIFICDTLFPPLVTADSKREGFHIDGTIEMPSLKRCESLFMDCCRPAEEAKRTDGRAGGAGVPLPAVQDLCRRLRLDEITPNALYIIQRCFNEAVEFERLVSHADVDIHAVACCGGGGDGEDEQHVDTAAANTDTNKKDKPSVEDKAEHSETLASLEAFYRFLLRLFASLSVAATVEQLRQPPPQDLTHFEPLDLRSELSSKEWLCLCRASLDQLGLKKTLGSDPLVVLKGIKDSCEDDIASVWRVCQWSSEHFIRHRCDMMLTRHAWYRLLISRVPSGIAERDENRCHALFVRLSGGGTRPEEAVLTAKQLASALAVAYNLDSLFLAADVGVDDMWTTLVQDAVACSDLVAARRPSMIEENSFRSFMAFLKAQISAYFCAEEMLLPSGSPTGFPKPLATNVMTLPVQKEQFWQLLRLLHVQKPDTTTTTTATTASVAKMEEDFASLSNGQPTAQLHHVVHYIAKLVQRELPSRRGDVWKRVSPLIKLLIADPDQMKRFFAFGIEKDHVLHATVRELQRSVGMDWTLDLFLPRGVTVSGLLTDAVGVASTTRVPPVKDSTVLIMETTRPFLVFLHTYLDVAVASDELLRGLRSRRRSSTTNAAALNMDFSSFLQLWDTFIANEIPLTEQNGDRGAAAMKMIFEVLSASTPGGVCSVNAIAHWAAHAAVRSRFLNTRKDSSVTSSASTKQSDDDVSSSPRREDSSKKKLLPPHPSSPWTQLRLRLPVGTDAAQSARRTVLYQQMDVTRRGSFITMREILDATQWLFSMDSFKTDLEPVVYRAVSAAKDSLRRYFLGADGSAASVSTSSDMLPLSATTSRVPPQYEKSVRTALSSKDVTPLEFRLVLLYLYQYLELYYMFDKVADAATKTTHTQQKEIVGTNAPTAAEKVQLPSLSADGMIVSSKGPIVKQITYLDFTESFHLLGEWGVSEEQLREPDVLFRRINGGRDGVILFTDFAIWASHEELHVEEPTFPK